MALTPPKKRLFIVAGLLLVALIGAAPFAWTFAKKQRAEKMLAEAESLVDDENFAQAYERARAAAALSDDLSIARLVATLSARLEPLKAPPRWLEIYETTNDPEDAYAWFDALYALGDVDNLRMVAQLFAEKYPNSAEALIRRARLARTQENLDQALQLAKRAANTPSAPGEILLAYVQLTQLSDRPGIQLAGIEFLEEMIQRDDKVGLIAARNYLQAPGLTNPEILAAAKRLGNHPLAEREDRLREIVVRRNLGNRPLDELLAEATSLFELNDPAELVELGRWLNQNQRTADLLEIVDVNTATQRRDLFLVWADAMALEGRWEELDAVIKRPRLPIEPFVQKLFEARIKAEQGNEPLADLIWSRAILDAKDDAEKLEVAYHYALKLGWAERARVALERLTVLPGTQRKAFEELMKLDQQRGDVAAMQQILVRMADLYPTDANVANDLAYVNLLLGKDIQASRETALELLRESDEPFLANIMTLALAQYRLGRKDLALEQLYPLPIDWDAVRPGFRAVYASILAANGHERESYSVMTGVRAEDLLPQELELLQEARGL